jgi:hypothetical protein
LVLTDPAADDEVRGYPSSRACGVPVEGEESRAAAFIGASRISGGTLRRRRDGERRLEEVRT